MKKLYWLSAQQVVAIIFAFFLVVSKSSFAYVLYKSGNEFEKELSEKVLKEPYAEDKKITLWR